jgi:hypothetical protein
VTPSSGRKMSKNEWRQMTSPSRTHIEYFAHNKRENSNSHGVAAVLFILNAGLSSNADRQVARGDYICCVGD